MSAARQLRRRSLPLGGKARERQGGQTTTFLQRRECIAALAALTVGRGGGIGTFFADAASAVGPSAMRHPARPAAKPMAKTAVWGLVNVPILPGAAPAALPLTVLN